MVVTESEMMSHDEVDSPLQSEQQQIKHHGFSSLGRQSSIYSLTLDEFQHTLCESGKNFGSMNMDEFLTSIWTAEENQAINAGQSQTAVAGLGNAQAHFPVAGASAEKRNIEKQVSLPRQGSLTLPAPLCRKTVDEVWSEIHKAQQGQNQNGNDGNANSQNPKSAPRQPTFGEMTLEDFLVKAGIVREHRGAEVGMSQSLLPPQQYGVYQNSNHTIGAGYVSGSIMGLSTSAASGGASGGATGSGGGGGITTYQPVPQGGSAIGDTSGYAGNSKRNSVYSSQPPPAVCYGGRVVNGGRGGGGGGGYPPAQPMGMAGPVSPVSPDGMCTNQVDSSNQFGLDMGGLRGRKRIIDGPVEKVVERRQRRMIKNRESAARSRARKQAYTVELEAELNQLREENAHLKQTLAELERKRKQQYFKETKNVQTKAQRAKEKLRVMRRTLSCSL
ncbi:protein ABSCISIC ACID-INSENSITIVE 5 isoform X2 [Momordica charantia]|nr:protein ABSCISIC ACID-INSENSITIVE 5 isoform X2 [Momordica charantia]XP_022144788.1 protein ABSCISIC ACID-INSENSITIVE 5 isoform X2 [Momordica charantia]XP_022144789.1 protein ABSCISIC ACID-INSENSITIVE 5 isoform X2 [Momordica charantia]